MNVFVAKQGRFARPSRQRTADETVARAVGGARYAWYVAIRETSNELVLYAHEFVQDCLSQRGRSTSWRDEHWLDSYDPGPTVVPVQREFVPAYLVCASKQALLPYSRHFPRQETSVAVGGERTIRREGQDDGRGEQRANQDAAEQESRDLIRCEDEAEPVESRFDDIGSSNESTRQRTRPALGLSGRPLSVGNDTTHFPSVIDDDYAFWTRCQASLQAVERLGLEPRPSAASTSHPAWQ